MSTEDKPTTPVTPVTAATVIMLRDGSDGLEVLMVERTRKADFAGGALLFPGGKVDAADQDVMTSGRCALGDDIPADRRAIRIAGVREVFEESNILFAREMGSPDLISEERAKALSAKYRRPLLDGDVTLNDIAEAENLQIASDRLVPFAHWITPVGGKRRFDTHFLVARAPRDQLAHHDDWETLDTIWIQPVTAIADAEADRRRVVFPTRMNLKKVSQSATADEAVDLAAKTPVVTVLPVTKEVDGQRFIKIPIEAGYGISETTVDYSASDQPPPPGYNQDGTKQDGTKKEG
ncbi:MAG: NUDIX hydrolase [Alphaproteobacteria bacterium]|nr:NUDIX hydrolase [Alphaproteobacteria bacterium]